MKSANIREIKKELKELPPNQVMELCLRLCRFKKENKELLTYLLFEAHDEAAYIESIQEEIDERFEQVNRKSPYYVRKSFRSILSSTRKYIRYSGNKETEVELLLYFCSRLKNFKPDIRQNKRQMNLFLRLREQIEKKISLLHEDLQFDYHRELKKLSF
jgi:uncharacterized FlaG/YvyC family protein